MGFASQLKSERTRLGLTQEEAAAVLSTSKSWVEKAEYSARDPHILLQEGALARLAKLKPKAKP